MAALAVALLASMLAIISSPAGAQSPTSPTTNRLSGADRYATAVAVARSQVGAAGPTTGLVIASGESSADALSAAPLTSDTAPMLLVPKDSIPESVTDFISDFKGVLAANTTAVYFMGGENAISAANYTALTTALTTAGDTTPPSFIRLAGADRYATAALVAARSGMMLAADTLILVSGESWADGISAGVMSAESNYPIVLQTKTGNNASAKGTIDTYLAMTSSAKSFMIIGGESAIGTDTEEYLINTKGVPVANIRRLHGADRYATSLAVNKYLRATGAPYDNIAGVNTALVSGESPWDALSASAWGAKNNALVQLTPAAGGNASVANLAATLAAVSKAAAITAADYAGEDLFLIGGKNAVSDAAKTGFQGAAANNLTATLSGCVEGATAITLTLSGALTANELAGAITDNEGFEDLMTLNAVASTTRAVESASIYDADNAVFTITLSAAAAQTNVFKFAGVTEDVAFGTGADVFERSIGSASCTIANDITKPVVTVVGAAGVLAGNGSASSSAFLYITASEPVGATAGAAFALDVGKLTCDSGANTAAGVVIAVAGSAANTTYAVSVADGEHAGGGLVNGKMDHGDICSIDKEEFVDRDGNMPAADVTWTMKTDATAPTASVTAILCVGSAATVLTAGSLVMTAKTVAAGGSVYGAAGNSYRLSVVNSRGLMKPSVALDKTAKTITVTADTGYHTPNDVATIMLNDGVGDWAVTASTTKLTATVIPASNLLGVSDCTVNLTANEPVSLLTAGITVSVAGLNAGYISTAAADANTAAHVAAESLIVTTTRVNRTITFSTKVLGAGSFAWAASVNGLNDVKGNQSVTPVTFTAG